MEYDLPMSAPDKDDLLKKQLLVADEEGDLLVNYKDLLQHVAPPIRQAAMQDIALAAILI